MRLEWQIGFWIGALLLLILLLWLFSGVLLPFAAAMALSYLLNPVVDRLERLGLNRLGAVLLILAGFAVLLALIIVLILPVFSRQLASFLEALPSYAVKLEDLATELSVRLTNDHGLNLLERLGFGKAASADLRNSTSELVNQAAQWGGTFVKSIWTSGAALIGLLSLLVLTPVVTFYMLVDWEKMVATVDSLVPLRHRQTVRELARQIDAAMAGFLRGQSLVCLFLGAWYGIGLSLIGLNFGLLIGISAGFLSFIPYVGSLTALDPFGGGRHRSGLAGMAPARHGVSRRRDGPIPRRQCSVAETRRRIGRAASGLADLRPARVRLPVRLHRPHRRRARGRRRRRHPALRGQALPRKQALYGDRRAGLENSDRSIGRRR